MVDILHISASPKGERSTSERMATAFLEAYAQTHPDDVIRRLNVFEAELPDFGKLHAEAKFAPYFQEDLTPEHLAAWAPVLELIAAFDKADKIVISCPMWNYSVPWRLKLYLDCLVQPGRTFGYDPAKMLHIGLLRNRPVQLLLTRSSTMPGDPNDFQLPYLKFIMTSIGLADVRALSAWQTTKYTPEERAAYVARFEGEAREAASTF
ncbi:FMN-dependent NADH-azoreductase [Caulobacter sp. DWP3-1-3b2]|uniref:FMN-dependent NADH-azoreductase n=1 Tax=Caulobacter sp. DWP3-1-3b2 TaxID=2804643 RepID=UPI003CE77700